MFTSPGIPSACCALVANRLRARALVSFDGRSRLLTSVQEQMGGRSALPEYGSKLLLGNAIPRPRIHDRRDFRQWNFTVNAGSVVAPIAGPRCCETVATPDVERE